MYGIPNKIKTTVNINSLYESENEINLNIDKFGIRSISCFNNPSEIDVLTIGGSTTKQTYIDDSLTWQSLLEKKTEYNLNFGNAGIDGQSTIGNIKSMELWLNKIKDLSPKYIILYVGINDIMAINNLRESDIFKLDYFSNLICYNLIIKIKQLFSSNNKKIGHYKVNFSRERHSKNSLIENHKSFYRGIGDFKKRLLKLISLSKELGAEPVIISHPVFFFKKHIKEIIGFDANKMISNTKVNGLDIYKLMTLLSKDIDMVCKENNVNYINYSFCDKFNENDFYDFIHLNNNGTQKLSKLMYNSLKDKLK